MIVTIEDIAICNVMKAHLLEEGISAENSCVIALETLAKKLTTAYLKQ